MTDISKIPQTHKTVLLHETIDGLDIQKGDIVVDCTLNNGGHSKEILQRATEISLVGIDLDKTAIARAKENLKDFSNIHLVNENFRNIDKALISAGFKNADKIVADLGLSSNQLDSSGRGFTFRNDEPLLMTFASEDFETKVTAIDILNRWPVADIQKALLEYGEETFARKIAEQIEIFRTDKVIKTTGELVQIVLDATPKWYHHKKTHPATKTFQAIRIATNDELGALKEMLTKGFNLLNPKGRMAIISFHSLEDKIVKEFFKEKHRNDEGKLIVKKPLVPTREEIKNNPRSRSAKLRIIEKI